MDFDAELQKLLEAEEYPPVDPLEELVAAQAKLMEDVRKINSDISLQVEEVYDIVKEADENAKEVKNAAKREDTLLGSLILVNDLVDGLLQFIQYAGAAHVEALAAKREAALNISGLERLGAPGEHLDPRFHTVANAEYCDAPQESITRVLESGYVYRDNVLRKATVIISKGSEPHDSWH